jgi:nicotinamide-nucleotide amidase
LVCDETALEHIRALFARRGREMPERNRVQAFFPEGSRVVPNPEGTAPGIATEMVGDDVRPVRVYCLPGVPAEMRQMWDETLEKELGRLIGGDNCRCIRSRRIRCFGAGESAIEAMLPDLIRRGRHPRVGITASEATITLNVTAEGPTEQACLAAMEPTITTIRESLGQLVFGEGEDRLEDAVVRLLRKQGKTLATIEWATEGLVSQWLQTAAMGQEVAGGAVVNRSTPLARFLRLPGECPSDGEELSRTMARSWGDCVGADYALAVGPFPGEDSPGQNPDVVFMAMATPENVRSLAVPVASHPSIRTAFCAKCALNVVRAFLLGGPSSA